MEIDQTVATTETISDDNSLRVLETDDEEVGEQ